MRRIWAVVLALALSLAMTTNAFAVSATISPHSQSHVHGSASSWTLTWGGTGPYDVYFWYDIHYGASWWLTNTYTTSKQLSHSFVPCRSTTFYQELDNYDAYGLAADTSSATEAGGAC
jgi:hypothetical protein